MGPRFLIIAFLLAHAAIHTSFVTPAPPATAGGPTWPFDLTRSWLLSPVGVDGSVLRVVGLAMLAAVITGYALALLASTISLPGDLFAIGIAVGSVASLGLLVLFFHPWLVLGVLIDIGLLWAVAARWNGLGLVAQ